MTNKFSRTMKGGILMTGNTLGLSNGGDNINLFAVADVDPPGGSTTTDWSKNSSAGYLSIPAGATVAYALLMWAGTFNQTSGVPDINENIILTPPGGADMTISPDPENTVIAGSSTAQKMYTQAREITTVVQEWGEGFYKIGSVPSILGTSSVAVGWQIIIVYAHSSDPFRNINVWHGMESITGSIGTVDVAISGFRTPDISAPKARLIMGSSNGDANLTGDQILFGESVSSLVQLYGPNNPATNFICAQINGNDGLLDKSGTFGNNNVPIGSQPEFGQRHSFDITNIDVSYAVKNNQTSAIIRMMSTGDVYELFGLALQIDVNQAIIVPFVKTVDKITAKTGDELTYTFTAKNIGDADAFNTMFTDPIPYGTSFVPNSLTINGVPKPGEDPSAGVSLGVLPAFQTEQIIITFKVIVGITQAYTTIGNTSEMYFQYIPAKGEDPWESTIYSNEVETSVENNVNLSVIKSVDKSFANIGEVLTYTFDIQNTGNVPAEHTIFTDLIPAGISYITDSLIFNGIHISGNPAAGVSLGNIPVGISELSFQVYADNLPPQNPVLNKAKFDYDFEVISGIQSPTMHYDTNEVFTKINTARLDATKAVDKAYAKLGDTLLYTITIINSGSIPADHVQFKDVIATGAGYVAGSFKLNGATFSGGGDDPSAGIIIGSLPIGQSLVSFQAIVNYIPTPAILSNMAELEYDYAVSPGGIPVPVQTARTNTVVTHINDSSVTFVKNVDKQFADTGEILEYSFIINKTGSVNIDNVSFTDVLQVDLTYEANSLYINGVQTPGDPTDDINLGSISDTATVSFKARVGNNLPAPNPVTNQGILRYDYKVDPDEPPVPIVTINSNQVFTQINHAELTVSETIDRHYVRIGNELLYTVTISNTGNVLCEDMFFVDATAIGESCIPGSMTLNGSFIPGDPTTGVNIGNIAPGDTVVVTFKTHVDRIPFANQLISHVNIDYNYLVDPNRIPIQKQKSSNEVIAYVYDVTVGITKTADKAFANLGDEILYSFVITPGGNSSADNVLFQDILPGGVAFVPGSVLINGATSSGNPANGIDLGSINTIVNLSFKARVGNLLPLINPVINKASITYDFRLDPQQPPVPKITVESNQVSTQINNASLTAVKAVDKIYADVGEQLTYTITLTNMGNINADNVLLTDMLPAELIFLDGTMMYNGRAISGNPSDGVDLGSISQTGVLSFKAQLPASLPAVNPIGNFAELSYDFKPDPNKPPVPEITVNSNTVFTQVNTASCTVEKTVDEAYTKCGEILTYRVTIKNTGNTKAASVIFTDKIPSGTSFVADSLMVNGVIRKGASPENGVNIGDINANENVYVVFKVKVICL